MAPILHRLDAIDQAIGSIQSTLDEIQMTLKCQDMRTYNCTATRGSDRLCPLDGVHVACFPATMEALRALTMDQCQDIIEAYNIAGNPEVTVEERRRVIATFIGVNRHW